MLVMKIEWNHVLLAVIWQLITLSAWVISLFEDVIRDALRYTASRKWETRPNKGYKGEAMQC